MNGDNFEWEKGQAIADEGLSLTEKLRYVKASQFCSVACFLMSIPIITIYVIYSSEIENKYCLALLLLGIFSSLLGICVLVWTVAQQEVDDEEGTGLASKSNVMAIIIFCLSVILILLYILFLMFLYIQKEMSLDFYRAEHTPEQISNLKKDMHFFIDIFAICAVFQMVFNGLFAYSTYIVALTHQDTKTILNVLNVVWIFFSLMAFLESKYCKHLFAIREMDMYASNTIIILTMWISIFSICSSIVIYVINIKRSRVSYMALGTILLILITIYAGLNHRIIRDAQDARAGFINHCNNNVIQQCPRDWLNHHKCEKYLTKTINNVKIYDITTCPNDFQTYVWEDDVGKAQNEKKNSYSCLNMQCCYTMADSYSVWFYRLAFTTFGCICCGFLISLLCFLLSQKEQLSNEFSITVCDGIFGLIFVILIFFFFYSAFSSQLPYPPQRDQGSNQLFEQPLIAHHQDTKKEQILHNYSSQDNLEEQICAPFRNFLDKDFNLQTDCSNTIKCSDSTGLRVSLLSRGGKFSWDSTLNNIQDLRFFQKKYIKQVFSEANEITDDFVSIEGKPDSINNFYNKHLQLCGTTVLNPPIFVVESYQTDIPTLKSGTVQPEPRFSDHIKKKEIIHNYKEEKLHQKQIDIDVQKCQDNLINANNQYQIQCLGAKGKFQNEIGNFKKQIVPDLINQQYSQNLVGYITTEDFCNPGEQIRLQNVQVTINFKNQNKQYVAFASSITDANGYFKFKLPVFMNNIYYMGQISINHKNFLPFTMVFTIGGGNILIEKSLGNIPLVTPTGKPIHLNGCSGKLTHQQIPLQNSQSQSKTIYHYQIINNQHQDIQTATPLQLCQNNLNKINTNIKTCSAGKYFQLNSDSLSDQKQQYSKVTTNQHLEDTFTDAQRQQIDEIQFQNINLVTYDIMNKEKVGNAQVLIYKGFQPCQNLKLEPVIDSQTNNEGSLILYNIIMGTYTVHIKKQGYFTYCSSYALKSQNQQTQIIRAALAPRSDKIESGIVVFEHNNALLSASLTASVNFDKQNTCLITYFNQNCQDLTLNFVDQIDPYLGQAITFDHLGPYNYLFYVTKVPSSNEEKEIIEEIRAGAQLTTDQLKKSVHNEEFFQGDLKIKMYKAEQEYHISSYEIPDPTEDKLYDPTLSWLSLCVDGRKGFETQRPINKFWEKTSDENIKYWQDSNSYQSYLPNSIVCDRYYQELPYLD